MRIYLLDVVNRKTDSKHLMWSLKHKIQMLVLVLVLVLVLMLVLVLVLVVQWLLRKVYHICTSLIIIFGCRIVEHITSLAVVKNDAGDACQENKVSEEDVDDVVNTVAACAKEGM